jgi:SAM-dependent methyltransferase
MIHKKAELYVDDDRHIYQGEDAKKKLQENSDFKYADHNKGVTKVSDDRWKKAQKYEENCWFESLSASGDRNYQHYLTFDKYKVIGNRKFQNAIELGCGPFTNLRIISGVAPIQSIDLEDPLISKYLSHPNVRYKQAFLRTGDFALDPFLIKAIRKSCRLFSDKLANRITLSRHIPIDTLHNVAIEDMPANKQYDLVVIINVIEHCKDIEKIFQVIKTISKPGTIFIFADKKYDGEEVYNMLKDQYYEAGHPLMVDFKLIRNFLDQNFKPLFEKTITEKGEEESLELEFDTFYYIGEKI